MPTSPRWTAGLCTVAMVLTGTLPAAEPVSASPWGICSSAEWFGEYPRFNPLVAQAGVRWFRAFPEWSTIQPKPDTWNWKPADDFLANATSNGIGVSGGFWYFAKWATTTGDTRTSPIRDLQHWSNYVSAAVTRYDGRIQDWEVYNEFNGSFAVSKDKPKEYADLVVAAYDAAKRANPAARIGMSCANFDLGFFDAAIKAGASGHFDFICVHPYENLGTLVRGGEDGYLSMAGSIRKMLAENAQRADIDLWITEFGIQAPTQPDAKVEALQSDVLVKGHVLALAQGFKRICWFEARGPSYGHGSDHGIIRQDWSPRPCYQALTTMTSVLGATPGYLGWLNLVDGGYGFVFAAGETTVLTAWSTQGPERAVTFKRDVTLIDVQGARSQLPAGTPFTLSSSPVYILDPPASDVALAKANASKPFPWGGDYSTTTEVRCLLGATNTDQGISQRNPQTTSVVNMLDYSCRRSNTQRDSEGVYAYFRVDPLFASFGTKDLDITFVVRRATAAAAAFDICYESLKGYRGTGQRWEVPAGEAWSEHTWRVGDANFVGGWGWNFRSDLSGSRGDILIKEVRVRKATSPGK